MYCIIVVAFVGTGTAKNRFVYFATFDFGVDFITTPILHLFNRIRILAAATASKPSQNARIVLSKPILSTSGLKKNVFKVKTAPTAHV